MLNPDLSYVEIEMGERSCPTCGDALDPAFVAADEALVALELSMSVFNVEREEHAARIARSEIGEHLESIPLEVLSVAVEDGEREDEDEEAGTDGDTEDSADVLPEFDDLLEDS
jgi:uncharacterized protein (UPF0212 family)